MQKYKEYSIYAKKKELTGWFEDPEGFLVVRLGFAQGSPWAPCLEVEDEVVRVGEEWKGLPYGLPYL